MCKLLLNYINARNCGARCYPVLEEIKISDEGKKMKEYETSTFRKNLKQMFPWKSVANTFC